MQAALKASLLAEAFFKYRPTSIAKRLRTFPINDNVLCTPSGDLNLIKHFSLRRVGK